MKAAQKAAADAQASADKANAALASENQAVTDNDAAVNTLQTTVGDLKANQVSLTTTLSDETTAIKKSIDSPVALHYKGITITPGGYLTCDTVYRTKATGGGMPTAWSSLLYESADAYSLSEFFGGANASRLSILLEGKGG